MTSIEFTIGCSWVGTIHDSRGWGAGHAKSIEQRGNGGASYRGTGWEGQFHSAGGRGCVGVEAPGKEQLTQAACSLNLESPDLDSQTQNSKARPSNEDQWGVLVQQACPEHSIGRPSQQSGAGCRQSW